MLREVNPGYQDELNGHTDKKEF